MDSVHKRFSVRIQPYIGAEGHDSRHLTLGLPTDPPASPIASARVRLPLIPWAIGAHIDAFEYCPDPQSSRAKPADEPFASLFL
jgi:hypothetical protein